MLKTQPKNKTGPIIKIWINKNSTPLKKLTLMFWKFTLLEVCPKVSQPLFRFHTILGNNIIITVIKKYRNFNLFLNSIFLKSLSKKTNTPNEIKKYIAAYLDKNARPKKIPRIIKLNDDGLFLMFISISIDIVQKNNNKTSVDIKKEEKLTAGITKKVREQINE